MSKFQVTGEQLLTHVQERMRLMCPSQQELNGPVITAFCSAMAEAMNRVLIPIVEQIANPVVNVNALDAHVKGWENVLTGLGRHVVYKKNPVTWLSERHPKETYHVEVHSAEYNPAEIRVSHEQFEKLSEANRDKVNAAYHAMGVLSRAEAFGEPSWACKNPCCPPRAATTASAAPTCYTCGGQMSQP